MKKIGQRITDKIFLSFVGSYLIGGWAIVQFVDWIVTRYNYDNGWTDLILSFLLLLLPGIVIVAWRKTGEISKKHSGLGILSANVFLAFLVSFFGFKGGLSAKTETVTVINEEGKEITRAVPNQSLVKRIVLFPFQGENVEQWQALG